MTYILWHSYYDIYTMTFITTLSSDILIKMLIIIILHQSNALYFYLLATRSYDLWIPDKKSNVFASSLMVLRLSRKRWTQKYMTKLNDQRILTSENTFKFCHFIILMSRWHYENLTYKWINACVKPTPCWPNE